MTDIRPGDRFRLTVEGVYSGDPIEDVLVPGGSIEFDESDVLTIERVVEQFKPGDVVKVRPGRNPNIADPNTILALGEDGFLNMTYPHVGFIPYGNGGWALTLEAITSDDFEKVYG